MSNIAVPDDPQHSLASLQEEPTSLSILTRALVQLRLIPLLGLLLAIASPAWLQGQDADSTSFSDRQGRVVLENDQPIRYATEDLTRELASPGSRSRASEEHGALYDPNGVLVGRVDSNGEIIPEIRAATSEQTPLLGILPITQMLTDFERPYVYALRDDGAGYSLLFINTDTEMVEKSLPIGQNPTDMSINYSEAKLYVTNWGQPLTRVVNLQTQTETTSLALGTDVYKLNAGRPGRIYYEEEDQWIDIKIIDTITGNEVGQGFGREGDAEIDPTGTFYYHCDNNISNAHIHKIDISTDTPVEVATSLQHPFGSRNLVLSGDGSRLFWSGYIYDADLEELANLGSEIYATTLHGTVAFSSTEALNPSNGQVFYTLPVSSTVMAVSGDQEKFFLFDANTGDVQVIPMSTIATVPGPGIKPDPADGSTISLPLEKLSWALSPTALSYEVYFGTDSAAVAAAGPGSPEFLGSVTSATIDLPTPLSLGQTYYWRVDTVGFSATTPGSVWSFDVATIQVSPKTVAISSVSNTPVPSFELTIDADGAMEAWSLSEPVAWLVPNITSSITPSTVTLDFDTTGLPTGLYTTEITFTAGGAHFTVPVSLELIEMALTQMLSDHERPYVYGLQRGSGNSDDAFLLFINTDTEQVERVLPIGSNATDMSINYGEGRLYVTNWLHAKTRVVDLVTQQELLPLELGTDVYKLNAGRPGRIYYEEEDQWIGVKIIDTTTGNEVGQGFEREGDAEIDPTGTFYYHCDNNISNAHIHKIDISTDTPVEVATSLQHPFGSRNLVLSGDGSRLFWRGYIYDADLEELANLGSEIYATTLHGTVAFSSTEAFDTVTEEVLYTLPFSSTVMAVSGNDDRLFIFDPAQSRVQTLPVVTRLFADGFESGDTGAWSSTVGILPP